MKIPLHCLIKNSSLALLSLILASCATKSKIPSATAATPDKPEADKKPAFFNPYPAGSYDHFKAEPSYPKTYSVWKDEDLFEQTNPSNSSLLISLSKQRAFLMNDGKIVLDYPICSGIESRPTPVGTYPILERVVDKKSNRYGKFLNAAGDVVNSNADAIKDKMPKGGKFEGAGMKYWMRMTWDGVGHHIGPVKRYPASHACVRGPSNIMPDIYPKTKIGTIIKVEE